MKKDFEVIDNESIEECLKRMEKEGYNPIKRSEKPIFKEEKRNGKVEYIPVSRKIVFKGVKNE
ncbi:NETI motif-containing protein [Bacillus sp. SD088]|uniref:NETI motif-containing protein n=1 Tax=Bacillus sp. SD088 TaxID=2782012 RepID=UPI001A972BFF|nr:NETI motif-containing protein [Bacillus sp. SD088]MBO0996092.1 NETI motif-containing protein [Bacillus sp. SD088]